MKKDSLPYKEVEEAISNAKSITILSHLNPDADALGTALGIYNLLAQDKSKKVEVVNASTVLPRYLDFLPNFKKIKHHMDYTDSLIIACDCANIARLGFSLKDREIINIDHHESNTKYGTINAVLPLYASSSQVAFKLFSREDIIGSDVATCFYAALLSDTRYFTTSSVNEEVFSVAKELVSLGAKPDVIAMFFTQRRALSSLRILERVLASLSLKSEAQLAVLCASKDDIMASGATMSDMEGIVDYAKSLTTVKIAIFAIEAEGGIRISLRSKGIDVSQVAIALGGGGHKTDAGVILENYGLEEAILVVSEEIKKLHLLQEKK